MDPALCAHGVVTSDPVDPCDGNWQASHRRECLTCGFSYDRGDVLVRLEAVIRERYRLPPSPWTAEERGHDLD